jgi:hypothetical protein
MCGERKGLNMRHCIIKYGPTQTHTNTDTNTNTDTDTDTDRDTNTHTHTHTHTYRSPLADQGVGEASGPVQGQMPLNLRHRIVHHGPGQYGGRIFGEVRERRATPSSKQDDA